MRRWFTDDWEDAYEALIYSDEEREEEEENDIQARYFDVEPIYETIKWRKYDNEFSC